mgnify:CR=1 FL=1
MKRSIGTNVSGIKDIRRRLVENQKHKATTPPPFPKNMLAELTNTCNHRCIFCANRKMTRLIPTEMRKRLPGLPAAGEARCQNSNK